MWPGTGTRGTQPLSLGISGWHNLDRRGYGRMEPRRRSPGYPYTGCTSPAPSLMTRGLDDKRKRIREERRRWCFHWRRRRPSCTRGSCGRRGSLLTRKAFCEHAGPEGAPRLQSQRRLERGGAYRAGWSEGKKKKTTAITILK